MYLGDRDLFVAAAAVLTAALALASASPDEYFRQVMVLGQFSKCPNFV